jgi:hypothetical protein
VLQNSSFSTGTQLQAGLPHFLTSAIRTSSINFYRAYAKDGMDSEMQLRAASSDADRVSRLAANASSTIGWK